jgi:hypothetical protein
MLFTKTEVWELPICVTEIHYETNYGHISQNQLMFNSL